MYFDEVMSCQLMFENDISGFSYCLILYCPGSLSATIRSEALLHPCLCSFIVWVCYEFHDPCAVHYLPYLYCLISSHLTFNPPLPDILHHTTSLFLSAAVTAPEQDPVDEIVQSYLQGMGFVRADIAYAMQATHTNETDVVMEYLLNNPRLDEFYLDPSTGDANETFRNLETTGDGVGVGAGREVGDLERAVPDALSALVGDISTVDASEDSLLLVAETSQALAADDDDTGVDPGSVLDSLASNAFGSDQDHSAGGGEVQPQVGGIGGGGGGGADVAGLRRDLGQLISELSRLCVDGDATGTGTGTGTPADESALPSLLTASVPLPVPPPASLESTPVTPPHGPSASALDPVQGVQGEYSTPRGPADARLVLQALGRRGLREEDSSAPTLSTPPGDGNDSVVSH